MRRALVAVVAVVAAAVLPYSAASAAGSGQVLFVHGFGSVSSVNSVDLYANGTYYSTFQYGQITSALGLPLGQSSTLLVCNAQPNPPATTGANCPNAATPIGPATGFSVAVPADLPTNIYEVLASDSGGDPTLTRFTPDLTCNTVGESRLQVFNGIEDPNIDVAVNNSTVNTNLSPGSVGSSHGVAQTATIHYRSTGTTNDLVTTTNKALVVNTDIIAFATGSTTNEYEYSVIYTDEQIPNTCTNPTTTSTSTVTPVTVTPRFTG